MSDKTIETVQENLQSENTAKDENNENQIEKDSNKQEYREKVKSSFGIKSI